MQKNCNKKTKNKKQKQCEVLFAYRRFITKLIQK